MGSGRRFHHAALMAAGVGSHACTSPAVPWWQEPTSLAVLWEARAALGSCLIFLCLKLAWLDALSSDAVRRRENKRHSCRVRGAQGAELSHSAVRHVPLTDTGCRREAVNQK